MPAARTVLSVLRDRILAKHCSRRTEEAYAHWVRGSVRFHGRRHPREIESGHVRDSLTHLARDRQVSASTQNQALAALLFLYRDVLGITMAAPLDHLQAKRPHRLPVVLSRDEVGRVLEAMRDTPRLVDQLRTHLATVERLHRAELAGGGGYVALPGVLRAKLGDSAARSWVASSSRG